MDTMLLLENILKIVLHDKTGGGIRVALKDLSNLRL